MSNLDVTIDIKARNRMGTQARKAKREVASIVGVSKQLTREHARQKAVTQDYNRRLMESVRLEKGLYRGARRISLEEARQNQLIRERNRLTTQLARRQLGLDRRGGIRGDPDAPATNLSIAAGAADRLASAGQRALTSIAGAGLEFGTAVQEVSTLTDNISGDEIRRISTRLSKDFGQLPTQEAKAFYQVVSAGYTDTAQASRLLTEANRGAVAGVATTEQAFDALNSIMRPYGMAAEDAARANDLLFTTVKDAKTTIPELGQSLAQATPLAAEAGVSVEELLASFSALTAGVGMNTRQAATAMRGFSAKIIKPSAQGVKEFDRLKKGSEELSGFRDMQEALQALGVRGFLKAIEGSKKFRKETMGKLFEDVEGLAAVLSLAGESSDEFDAALSDLQSSGGAAQRAFNKMAEDPSFQLKQARAEWEAAKIEFSRGLLPVLTKSSKIVLPILDRVTDFAESHPKLFTAMAGAALGTTVVAKGMAPLLQFGAGLAGLAGFSQQAGEANLKTKALMGSVKGLKMAAQAGTALAVGLGISQLILELTGANDELRRLEERVSKLKAEQQERGLDVGRIDDVDEFLTGEERMGLARQLRERKKIREQIGAGELEGVELSTAIEQEKTLTGEIRATKRMARERGAAVRGASREALGQQEGGQGLAALAAILGESAQEVKSRVQVDIKVDQDGRVRGVSQRIAEGPADLSGGRGSAREVL